MVALAVWQLQSTVLLLSLLAFLLWAVRELNLSVGGGEGGRGRGMGGGREWVWLVGGVGMMLWEGVREGREAAREALVWSQVEGGGVLGRVYRAVAAGGGGGGGGRGEGGKEEGGREGRGWTTDGPVPEEGLRVEGVWVRKEEGREGGRASDDEPFVLKDISLQACPGEILMVCGSEGAGKSVLLRALASPLPPSRLAGSLALQGRRVGEWEREAWKEGVMYLPGVEESACFSGWTVGESVRPMSMLLLASPRAGAGEREREVEIQRRAGRTAGGVDRWVEGWREGWATALGGGEGAEEGGGGRPLSAGEWRRVQLARALAWMGGREGGREGGRACPRLVVLDEPTLLMSEEEAKNFMGRLRETMGRVWGNPVVVIGTQSRALGRYVDKVVVLHKGRMVASGPPSQVLPSQLREGGREGGQGQGTGAPMWLPPAVGREGGREGGGGGGGGGGRRPIEWGGGSTTGSDWEESDIYTSHR